ncbi:MAG: hypothetical protein ACYC5N_01090, partial [Endomicrobiales bacterium]
TNIVNAPAIDVKIFPSYNGLGLTGTMRVKQSLAPEEIESGQITGTDSLGGTYSLSFSHVQYAAVNASLGLPTGGTMSITSSHGYTGTFIFNGAGGAYTLSGAMAYQGQQAATVSLAFDSASGKYAGSYADGTGTFEVR